MKLSRRHFSALPLALGSLMGAKPAQAYISPLRQAIAEAVAGDSDLAPFYRARSFEPLWLSKEGIDRRQAFMFALETANAHGLPKKRYRAQDVADAFKAVETTRDKGALEIKLSKLFMSYAQDVSSGVVTPSRIDPELVLTVPRLDAMAALQGFSEGNPFTFIHSLWPKNATYTRLLAEKLRLEAVAEQGGWGPRVSARSLKPGAKGRDVVALRNRLINMGYMERTLTSDYDTQIAQGVRNFQKGHGLAVDGDAGPATLREINASVEDRINQVLLGLERQRWMNRRMEKRHIFVNIADFTAQVVDEGKVTFETVVVVGANDEDRRTPEFSDTMTHMVINPTWHVPRSIATKEYLPRLKKGGAGHLKLYRGGKEISREGIDFSQFDEKTFPFDLKQPPSNKNALGLVKFMFPNRWNIYLHDSPAKSLFNRTVRTFSHGCIRVKRPFELAAHLLAPQESDPMGKFKSILRTKNETYVYLDEPIGVHLVYWTVWVDVKGQVHYRPDAYGRDRRLMAGLQSAGVDMARATS